MSGVQRSIALTKAQAIRFITRRSFQKDTALRLWGQAIDKGQAMHGLPNGPGYAIISRIGTGSLVQIEIGSPAALNLSGRNTETVASKRTGQYSSRIASGEVPYRSQKGSTTMPPRRVARAKPAPAPEPEPTEEAKDYTVYATKQITPIMEGFADWLRQEVGDIDKMDADRIVSLAGTLRMEYQKSEFCQELRERLKAERAAGTTEAEEEEEEAPARPVRRGSAKPVAAKAPAGKPTAPTRKRGKAAAEAPY